MGAIEWRWKNLVYLRSFEWRQCECANVRWTQERERERERREKKIRERERELAPREGAGAFTHTPTPTHLFWLSSFWSHSAANTGWTQSIAPSPSIISTRSAASIKQHALCGVIGDDWQVRPATIGQPTFDRRPRVSFVCGIQFASRCRDETFVALIIALSSIVTYSRT